MSHTTATATATTAQPTITKQKQEGGPMKSNATPVAQLSLFDTDPRLSPFAQVAVGADRTSGKIPCVHDGMTLDDAVLITGLPRQEAARRLHKMKASSDPKTFAQQYLSEGAGEQYQAGQASLPLTGTESIAGTGTKPEPATMENLPSAEIIKFPLSFGDDTRLVSNTFARCPVFAAVNERGFFKDWTVIYDDGKIKVEIKGDQLNQDDKDTFIHLLMKALEYPLGRDISFSVNEMLEGMRKHNHKDQRIKVFQEVDRLVTTSVRFTMAGKGSYVGHFLDDARTPLNQQDLPQHQRNITYRVNPKLARFFSPDLYTLFNYEDRLKLGRNCLAKWLHLWVIGHADQYPHKVETIREKCGSKTKDLKKFRQMLRASLDVLEGAGIITAWQINDDLVHMQRTPSAAQIEHLAKKPTNIPKKPPKK
jgi:hypothetical protein